MTLENLGCLFEGIEKMKEIPPQGRIVRDGQGQFALRACESPGPLQDMVAQGCQLLEVPRWVSPLRCSPCLGLCPHLKFPSQIVGQDGGHQVQLIARETPDRNIVHLALRLQFSEDLLLTSSPVMKPKNLSHADRLVRHNHRVLIPIRLGDEQIQLDRFPMDLFAPLPDEQEPIPCAPFLGFPRTLKIRPRLILSPPALPLLDQPLQLHKSLERNRKGKLDSPPVEQSHHLVAEKRTVHPDFDGHVRKNLTNSLDTLQHKSLGSVGIMHVARPVMNIKHLTRLSNRAEQGIITARSFFLAVESDRCAFPATPLGRKHNPIKIQGQSRKPVRTNSTKTKRRHNWRI